MDDSYDVTEEQIEASLQASLDRIDQAIDGEDEIIAEMHEHAARQIEHSRNSHPASQMYIKRIDNGLVVRSQEEYDDCVSSKIPLGMMTYGQAVSSLNSQTGAFRTERREKKRRKTAKQARRRNRK